MSAEKTLKKMLAAAIIAGSQPALNLLRMTVQQGGSPPPKARKDSKWGRSACVAGCDFSDATFLSSGYQNRCSSIFSLINLIPMDKFPR